MGSPYAKEQLHNVVTQEWNRKGPFINLTEVKGELIIIMAITYIVLIMRGLDAARVLSERLPMTTHVPHGSEQSNYGS